MKRWLILQNWHISALFVGLSMSTVLFAWTTFNLYNAASDNFHFIANYGVMGLTDGGLLQFLEICWNALASLLLFLLFKGCETEIVHRWRDLHDGEGKSDSTDHM
jgi:hypothetical protein